MKAQPSFNERLKLIQEQKNSLLCVGIDPALDRLPAGVPKNAVGVAKFCENIIHLTKEHVCAYKFNSAFFEVLGREGMDLLHNLQEMIPDNIIKIYDVKRGDIGNTAKQYARAAFHLLYMDAVTINPYMGYDAVEPFLMDPTKGVFILGLTSNKGSEDIQQQIMKDGHPLYNHVVHKITEWNTKNNLGIVVGATKEKAFREIRNEIGSMPILAPGIGAQGGDMEAILKAGLTEDGYGLVIPISRAIIFSSDQANYAQSAGEQAELYKNQINRIRQNG